MIIDDGFDIDAPVDRVWSLLKDIPKVATCIPRAEITEVVDERTYRAKVSVRVGPVEVSYRAVITVQSLDDATHTAKFHVKGDEAREVFSDGSSPELRARRPVCRRPA